MSDTHDARFHQHEEILRSLTAMLAAQQSMNTRVEGFIREQREINQQQREINQRLTVAIERLEITQARMETLFARVFRPDTTGRDT